MARRQSSRSGAAAPAGFSAVANRATASVAVGILAVLVSVIGSWRPSLWGDEAASVLSARRSVSSLFTMLGNVDAVHGVYYLGLHFWIDLFGASAFSVRLPSALAVGVAAAVTVAIGERLASRTVGVVAGLVCAVLPRITYDGEEARSYAFSVAIAAILTLIVVAAVRSERRRPGLWVLYAVFLGLGTGVFLFQALTALAHGVALLLMRRRGMPLASSSGRRGPLLPWLLASVGGAVLSSPVIVQAYLERNQIEYLQTRATLTVASVVRDLWFWNLWLAALGWALMAVAVVVMLRRWRVADAQLGSDARGAPDAASDPAAGTLGGRPLALIPTLLVLLPPLTLIVTSPVLHSFTPRYLGFAAPGVALLMTLGAASCWAWLGRRIRTRALVLPLVTVLLVAVAAAPTWVSQRGPYAKDDSDWAVLSARMGELARPGDAVAFDDGTRLTWHPRLAMRTYPAGFVGLDDVTLKTPYWNAPLWYDQTYTLEQAAALGRLDGVNRLWMIERETRGVTDTYGLATLQHRGFLQVQRIALHSSVIVEFQR